MQELTCTSCKAVTLSPFSEILMIGKHSYSRTVCAACDYAHFEPIKVTPPKKQGVEVGSVPSLAKQIFKNHAILVRIDDERAKYYIEFTSLHLLSIAEKYRYQCANSLNRLYGKSYDAVFFSLEQLKKLARDYPQPNHD